MFKPLVIGDITARLPIIQGGMGIGVSLSGLAGAVAAAGGVGVISAAQIGFADEGFEANPLKANLAALARHIRLAREKAPSGILGVNLMVAMRHYEEYVDVAVKNGIDLIISGAGLPVNLPELVSGSRVKIAPIVSSLKAAKVLLERWLKRYSRKADAIVVEGPMAGGHLGFSPDYFNEPHEQQDFDGELSQILEYAGDTPVIFGGGVYTKADIEKYLSMGCAGVQMATRFVGTYECDASPAFKEAYLKSVKDDITIVKSPVGLPGRAITNTFLKKAAPGQAARQKCLNCLKHCDRENIPYCISRALISSVNGDTDGGLMFCGQNAYRVDKIVSVQELLDELTT